jgi:signal transduction histidine kinase
MTKRDTWQTYWRLSFLSIGIALLAALVLLAGQRWYSARQDLIGEVREDAQIFGANSSAALAFDDHETATDILSAFSHSRMIVEAALYRTDGSLLARFKARPEMARWAPDILPTGSGLREIDPGLRYSQPIQLGDRVVGHLVLWVVLDTIYREVRDFVSGFLATALVAGALAYLAGYRLRQRMVDDRLALQQSAATIRLLAAHRDKLVEGEHKRIAREIHDELGQLLTAAGMGLKRLSRASRQGKTADGAELDEIEGLISEAMRSVRNIAADLRPAVLNIGFHAAIEWLAERMLDSNGILYKISIPQPPPEMDDETMTALFRIVQESLTNVVRHAKAQNVSITLTSDAHRLWLRIADDGVGFTPREAGSNRFGLVGMRERAAALGAQLDILSHVGAGTCVQVVLNRQNPRKEN